MNRAFLRWFYVGVQFIMLAVSIPKVATLFHAYDKESMGALFYGVDTRSWLVGIAIDLTATFTTWAAMAKYDESRRRSALFAPAVIILFCSALSVIANYEDAATLNPEQYANVSIFTHPALLINPILISAPPVLVLLLILLVPSVLAQPRIKSAAEIEAEADEQVARIQANARVRNARIQGLKDNVSMVTSRQEDELHAPSQPAIQDATPDETPAPDLALTKMTRAMWQAMKLSDRVMQSGVISPQEVSEVLGISLSHARNLTKEITTRKVDGRSGVPYMDLIDSLYDSRAKNSYAWAHKLELALGVKKRKLQAVPDDDDQASEDMRA